MKAEIIIIGNEILNGTTLDTNSQRIATELEAINIKIQRRTTIPDDKASILEALEQATKRSNLVITTGGLGPTKDDMTKNCFCEFLGVELVLDQQVMQHIEQLFKIRQREMLPANQLQAMVPSGSTVLHNAVGTAPGLWMEKNAVVVVALPGVPYETEYLLINQLIPALKKLPNQQQIIHHFIQTAGIGESWIAREIEAIEDQLPAHIQLAYLPSFGSVKLRLTAMGTDREAMTNEVNLIGKAIEEKVGKYVYGHGNDNLSSVIGAELKRRNQTLGTAESCSSGFLSHLITQTPGASAYYSGSIIAYSYDLKEKMLGVKSETLQHFGAVSEETIREMAVGAKERLGTDYVLATSGIAGPEGGMPNKPVGTVWIALAHPDGCECKKFNFNGDRLRNTQLTALMALDMLRRFIL